MSRSPTAVRSLSLSKTCATVPLWAWVLVACTRAAQPTEVLVTVASEEPVTDLELRIRDVNYNVQSATHHLPADLTLVDKPFTLLVQPSPTLSDRFLVHVKGFASGKFVAMDAVMTAFEKNKRVDVKLNLHASFVDDDDDGFASCQQPGCDCNDQSPRVNPFTQEDCGDYLDNNCSGFPMNEGCPCDGNRIYYCTRLLSPLAESAAGIGACTLGTVACENGVLGTTCDSGVPRAEIPNNFVDDDCNGTVDDNGPCAAGAVRPCHRGFVDDPANPNPEARTAASDRAVGVCRDPNTQKPFGTQTCSPTGTWGACEHDVLPQRDVLNGNIGWAELPSNPATGDVAQCDGLDNDCDGKADEEPYYDADRDRYTICGACNGNNTTLCADMVDCNDANPDINPGAAEVCGNTVDEDCRCDHDPAGRAAGDPNSVIGDPSIRPDGSRTCPAVDQSLACGNLPRSDANLTGQCKDGPDSYYMGFGAAGSNGDCYFCGLPFGVSCNLDTGACSQKAADCGKCGSTPGAGAPVAAARPLCKMPGSGCTGTTAPTWAEVVGSDPYNECGDVSCANYYGGVVNNRCFPRATVTAPLVSCKAGGACQTAADLCPTATPAATAVPQAVCTQVASGCTGTTPPTFSSQPVGVDLLNECNSTFTCSDAVGGGPFYAGVVTVNGVPQCTYRANVGNNACNGAGACQTKAQACGAAAQGGAVPGRPLCQQPSTTSGCAGATGPVYTPVARGEDPYDDCAASACDGAGRCLANQGQACGNGVSCAAGTCVDGVCCESACTGTCMACAQASTGQANGLCRPVATATADAGTCSGSTGCAGTACVCVAGAAQCKGGITSTCTAPSDCASGICDCFDAACTQRYCAPVDCGCKTVLTSGTCGGNLASGTQPSGVCDGARACDSGLCVLVNGQACTADGQCVGTCISGTCQNRQAKDGPCDSAADCNSGNCKGNGSCN